MSIKTPYYLINSEQFNKNCEAVENAFRDAWGDNLAFGYSVKTNHHGSLLQMAKDRGWYAEVVSDHELSFVRGLGYETERIIFNGPYKHCGPDSQLADIAYINIDNLAEADSVCGLIESGKIDNRNTAIGLRINFDLESRCPGETTAAEEVSRFGLCYENGDLKKAIDLFKEHEIRISGIHSHYSTTTRSLGVFRELSDMVCHIAEEYSLELDYIDIGGGFFGGRIVEGKPDMREYADEITSRLKDKFDPSEVRLILEPGASVLATCVDYITTVVNTRDIRGERIVTVDGTVLHVNPLMQTRNASVTLETMSEEIAGGQIVCGCTCMEHDRFCTLKDAPELQAGDRIIVHNAGAYTMAFNSGFILDTPLVIVE